MDLYSKKIIGYTYGTSMTAELAVKAVGNACLNVKNTKDVIFHSDFGTQYTNQKFQEFISKKKMIPSFSRKGNPYDKAIFEYIES